MSNNQMFRAISLSEGVPVTNLTTDSEKKEKPSLVSRFIIPPRSLKLLENKDTRKTTVLTRIRGCNHGEKSYSQAQGLWHKTDKAWQEKKKFNHSWEGRKMIIYLKQNL